MDIETLVAKAQESPYVSPTGLDLIRRAYAFADHYHDHMRRASGERFIEHPLAVAYILADLRLDAETIAAALLH
ncbi:MAG: HD domain-containing protein, partial [Anaerolineae bacterium]